MEIAVMTLGNATDLTLGCNGYSIEWIGGRPSPDVFDGSKY